MKLPGLCDVCEGCLSQHHGLVHSPSEDEAEEEWMFQAHADLASLERSRDAGCTICASLWGLLNDEQVAVVSAMGGSARESLTSLVLFASSHGDIVQLAGKAVDKHRFVTAAFVDLPDDWPGKKPLPIFLLEPAAEALLDYPARSGSDSTLSDETLRQAAAWIDQCKNSHDEDCASKQAVLWHPTRLLDVGTEEADAVSLIETSGASLDCPYVTLSHRWGGARVFKLTKATAAHLHQGIAASNLPLTFQHAIAVTRQLGRKYIWIDSLCIYQDEDDKSDWQKEASLMEKVYANCEFNIAATGALDGSSGLFAKRSPEVEFLPTRVTWRDSEYVLTDFGLLERELGSAALNLRGWVLQERLLSPRILHFGRKQLFWECNKGVLCERFPSRLPPSLQNTVMATFSTLKKIRRVPNSGSAGLTDQDDGYTLWARIAKAYSRTAVTFSSDKLVALSGIARVMRQTFKDVYVAGMWRNDLAGQLLWQVDHTSHVDGRPSSRDFPYRAPTWSWLSVDGNITVPDTARRDGLQVEVVDVEIQSGTGDTTSSVTSARLTLRGRLRALQIRQARVMPADLPSDMLAKAEAKGLDLDQFMLAVPGHWILTAGGRDLELESGALWERMGPTVSLDVPAQDFDESNRLQELFMMSAGGPYAEPMASVYHEILLLRCIDRDAGRFHRIGLAVLNTEAKRPVFDLVRRLDDDEASLPCIAYDAEKHTHTIILE